MRQHIKTFVCILLLMVMVVPSAAFSAAAAEDTTLTFNLKYDQNKARSMLKNINDFRKANGKEELVFDYSLEGLAITRAEEIVTSFNHPRPGGGGTVVNVSENIAYGNNLSSADAGFNAFKNSSKGHDKNMIDSRWKGVAIAYAEFGGRHYWVQLFTPNAPTAAETSAKSGSGTARVTVQDNLIKSVSDPVCDTAPIEIELNKTGKTPAVSVEYTLETVREDGTVYTTIINSVVNPSWTSDAPEIASVEGTTINALKRGEAKLTSTVEGKTITVPVSVTGTSIKNAVVELEYTEAEFTGSELKPKVKSVKVGDQELVRFIDYAVQYSNNVEAGTATVKIVGKGEYSGEAVVNFTIKGCEHKYNEGKITKEATCKQEGEKVFTCSECGYEKKESIAKIDHTDSDKNNKCDVCGMNLAAPPEETTTPSEETTAPSEETTAPSEETTAPAKKTTAAAKKTTAAANGNTDNPDTGDHSKDRSAEMSAVLNVALIATALFVAYLVKIVVLERRKTDKRRNAIRR